MEQPQESTEIIDEYPALAQLRAIREICSQAQKDTDEKMAKKVVRHA